MLKLSIGVLVIGDAREILTFIFFFNLESSFHAELELMLRGPYTISSFVELQQKSFFRTNKIILNLLKDLRSLTKYDNKGQAVILGKYKNSGHNTEF